jgi:hypothetical protein
MTNPLREDNFNMTTASTRRNTGVDLDKLEEIATDLERNFQYRAADGIKALIDLARRAEPSVAAGAERALNGLPEILREASSILGGERALREPIVDELDGFAGIVEEFRAALASPAVSQMDGAAVAWLATDLDGRGDVAFTKDEARRRAGENCTEFVALVPAATMASATVPHHALCPQKGYNPLCAGCDAESTTASAAHAEFVRSLGLGRAQAPSLEAAPDLLSEIATALDLLADTKMTTSTYVNVTNVLHHCRDAITGKGCYGASHAANADGDTEQDAARYRFLRSEKIAHYRGFRCVVTAAEYDAEVDAARAAIASSAAQEKKNAD